APPRAYARPRGPRRARRQPAPDPLGRRAQPAPGRPDPRHDRRRGGDRARRVLVREVVWGAVQGRPPHACLRRFVVVPQESIPRVSADSPARLPLMDLPDLPAPSPFPSALPLPLLLAGRAASSGWSGWSLEAGAVPTASLLFSLLSDLRSRVSVRNCFAFSRAWPSCSPS